MREISKKFQEDLNSGMLNPILLYVLKDNNITIEIREHYINIYYRGGNMLRITEKNFGYNFEFDLNYIKENDRAKTSISKLPINVNSSEDVKKWSDMMPLIKVVMDNYFVFNKKTEREFQQLVVRENNIGSIAKKTDYYICDVEYQAGSTRFDLIAVKKTDRRKFRLALIEMKYADNSLKGESGIVSHVHKAYKYFLSNEISKLKEEMHVILETKQALGLVEGLSDQFSFTDEKPEFIFLLSNHKPASTLLDSEIHILREKNFFDDFCKKADLKFAIASFFGYGLFNDCIYNLDEFEEFNQSILNIIVKRKND